MEIVDRRLRLNPGEARQVCAVLAEHLLIPERELAVFTAAVGAEGIIAHGFYAFPDELPLNVYVDSSLGLVALGSTDVFQKERVAAAGAEVKELFFDLRDGVASAGVRIEPGARGRVSALAERA